MRSANPLSDSEENGKISTPPPPPKLAKETGSYSVEAFPNLVREENKVSFRILGLGEKVNGFKVSIFNPNGKTIWQGSSEDTELSWNPKDVTNGVYLYHSSIKIDDKWNQLRVKKLLILK